MPRTLAAGVWIYQAALHLYPPGFRREFAGEMARDFKEATSDAWRAGRWHGVFALWAHTGADFAATALFQWLRSGLPGIALGSAAFVLLSVGATAQFLPRGSVSTPLTEADRDLVTLLVMVLVVLMIVTAVLVFNLWFSRSLVRRLPTHRRF